MSHQETVPGDPEYGRPDHTREPEHRVQVLGLTRAEAGLIRDRLLIREVAQSLTERSHVPNGCITIRCAAWSAEYFDEDHLNR